METLLRFGVNHIDTAASYGHAEVRLGPWMARHRDAFFLASKTGERTYRKAKAEIYQSLERLQTDRLDLIQLHNLVDETEWATALGDGGALQAAVEARDQGLVRFIGVTGHGTTVAAMHRRSLERFDFDCVLLPYNFAMMCNPQYAADFEALEAVCQARNVAIQTIKGITRGPWNEKRRTSATWYEPLREPDEIDLAVRWVLGRPGLFLNTAGDIHLLPQVLDAASRVVQSELTDTEVERLGVALAGLTMEPLFV